MTKSASICQHLVSRCGPSLLNVVPEEPSYAAFLKGSHFGEATLMFLQALVLRYRRLEPLERRLPQIEGDYGRWFFSRLRKGLEMREDGFYAAGCFTAADVSLGYALLLAGKFGLGPQFTPEVAAYWPRLSVRTACCGPTRRSKRLWRHRTCGRQTLEKLLPQSISIGPKERRMPDDPVLWFRVARRSLLGRPN